MIIILDALFLVFEAGMKIIREVHNLSASARIRSPVDTLVALGVVLLICKILYTIPRTVLLGEILLTAYFDGATAIVKKVA